MLELHVDARTNRRGINPNDLPYIDWERPVNEGLGEGHGERREVQRTVLFDQKGSPFVWVDENYITYCLQKGWKIVGYGNFNRIRRHDGSPHEQLEAIRPMVEGRAFAFKELEDLKAQTEQLKAERAQLIAERSAIVAPAAEGDFRTQEEKNAGVVSVVLDPNAQLVGPGVPPTSEPTEPVSAPTGSEPGAPGTVSSDDTKGKHGKGK